MTDKIKMPVVGKRYRCEEQDCDWLEFKDFALRTNIVHNIVYCKFQRHFKEYEDHKYGSGGGYVNYTLGYFLKNFEELPDEPKEDQPTVKENLTDDKVQVALEELRKEITPETASGNFLQLLVRAQNLVNALDSQRNYDLLNQKGGTTYNSLEEFDKEYGLNDSNIPEKADIFERSNPPACSKCDRDLVYTGEAWQCEVCPGAKKEIKVILKEKPNCFRHNKQLINDLAGCEDCQEEKPKSMWKSVEELPVDGVCEILLKIGENVSLGSVCGYYYTSLMPRVLYGNGDDVDIQQLSSTGLEVRACLLTDFINHTESFENRIKKLEENNV